MFLYVLWSEIGIDNFVVLTERASEASVPDQGGRRPELIADVRIVLQRTNDKPVRYDKCITFET